MTSSRQAAANRSNAAKSTGPRTAPGKAVAARNATRHGVLAAELAVIPGERADDLDSLRAEFAAELAPVGPIEAALCERAVSAVWRLRRVQAAEAGVYNEQAEADADWALQFDTRRRRSASAAVGHGFARNQAALTTLSRYEAALERTLYSALHELQRVQAARTTGDVPPPAVVDVQVRGLPEGVG